MSIAMENKKNLSAARKKLQEYKSSKTLQPAAPIATVSGGTIFNSVNEVNQQSGDLDRHQNIQNGQSIPLSIVPPPPPENIPTFLNNLGRDLLMKRPEETDNVDPSFVSTSVSPLDIVSGGASSVDLQQVPLFTPSAPPLGQINFQQVDENKEFQHTNMDSKFTDAGQHFPVNFFQSAPTAHQYQPVSFNPPSHQQNFFYNQPQQSPMFFNVDGNSITPLQPYQLEGMTHINFTLPSNNNHDPDPPTEESYKNNLNQLTFDSTNQIFSEQLTSDNSNLSPNIANLVLDEETGESAVEVFSENNHTNKSETTIRHNIDIESIEEGHGYQNIPVLLTNRTPTPNFRRSSVSSQDEKDRLEIQAFQRMKSVQEALELQLEELRRDNERLLHRQSELVSQIEDNEKNVQELRRERDKSKEEAKKFVQPLHSKINNLYEENQRILKNSNEVGMELRGKLQEKLKQYEEMEQAFIVVSKSKMELAAELDQQREKEKELENVLVQKNEEISELRKINTKLEEKLKVEQQKEAIIHQSEDQRRHFQVQTETLQGELARANNKIQQLLSSRLSKPEDFAKPLETSDNHDHDHDHGHDHGESDNKHDHLHPENQHGHHDHGHEHGQHHHDHEHGQHHHDHEHGQHHHDHEHGHHHHDQNPEPRPPVNELEKILLESMKKRLHHLEWENLTFRADVDKLAVEAKEKKQFEEKFHKLTSECEKLRNECQRLELLVVQLQGENDTIGDYIALYQSQRLALKETDKEKDSQLQNLAKEREMLLKKMAELTQLLKGLKEPNIAEALRPLTGHQCHQDSHSPMESGQHTEIEGKIMNLITEISSSSLIENFHPCAVCSGRLMNV